ncbi:complex I subunit 4 family protein [Pedosphaera parvula]|uniref:Proton-translocating NADH-quinone oxidoreductase, chain M n=1 Tax=Pedosphaera parvula (strain Ellin514) TaxID=320771 RepID=B9XFX2_PEDPL|nr:NADH-quinone oxidoreductase subunit M [Pedosphaera parvula]EEF61134.1 proton-translocating NADH-quinone oxidoreductase, chain M [Pedosphaera parvula Ellin514]
MNGFPLISTITFIPLIGAIMLVGLDAERKRLARCLGLGFSLASLVLVAVMWIHFDSSAIDLQFVERHPWIPSFSAEYFVGVDGLGLLMVLLTALVTPMAMLSSWRISEKVPIYFAMMLFLEAGLLGTFTALNCFHWFLFWELSLVPAFFLIKLWGGPNRSAAATQFFVYTMVGSVAMLLSFLAIYLAAHTFDFVQLAEKGHTGELASMLNLNLGVYGLNSRQFPLFIFAGIFLGFAVKVPLIPFHTWLPTTYAEAPTGTTMLLTGAMSKMGVYGFIRILMPFFPEQMRIIMTPLLWLAVITIVFSAYSAFVQKDLKKVFAYSSINHLGYCLLGVFAFAKFTGSDAHWNLEKAAAMNGVMLQMFNHGLTASILFCFIGFLEQRSGGLRDLDQFGGLRRVAPVFCGLMGISIFASLGLPGLNGFIGEFLIFKGSFPIVTWATAMSVIGLLVTAIFLLTIIQRVFNGPLNAKWAGLPDLTLKECLLVLPATALMLVMGIYPQIVIGKINTTVMQMVDLMKY